jgi:hypothetical protein
MKLPEPTMRSSALGRGHISRSVGVTVRAAGRQNPSKTSKKGSISPEERIVETVEVAALTAAAAAGGLALSRSINLTAPPSEKTQALQKRTAVLTGSAPAPNTRGPNLEILWVTGPLFIAVAARSIAARLARYTSLPYLKKKIDRITTHPPLVPTMIHHLTLLFLFTFFSRRRVEATPAAQAMSRLSAAEFALTKQAESLSILTRQVDKVQIRTRLVSRDMREQVKELQALTDNHSEALLGAGARLAQIDNQVKGLEELVDAVQGIAAKQFRLIASVVGQGSKTVQAVGGSTSKKNSFEKKSSKGGDSRAAPAAVEEKAPLAANQQQGEVDRNAKDEWGRAVTAQSLQNKREEEEQEISSSAVAATIEEPTPVAQISIDDGRKMKLNEDGSVSFSF